MDALTIIFIVLIFYFFAKGFLKKEKNENNYPPHHIFNEYQIFFKEKLKKLPKGFLKGEFGEVLELVIKRQFSYLEFKDLKGLPFSIELISKTLISKLDAIEDDKGKTEIVFSLSYLYKPKEEYKQRIKDGHILREFGKFHEKEGTGIKDASKLPFPREVILESFCREYQLEEDEKMQNTMRVMVTYLANYQEGVGVEDLEIMGLASENYMNELKKFPEEEAMKLFSEKLLSKENVENTKKYNEFKKLVDKDREFFHDKMVNFPS